MSQRRDVGSSTRIPHLVMKLPDMGHPELAEGMV